MGKKTNKAKQGIGGRIDDAFYDLFNRISVITGKWQGEDEKIYAVEFRLWLNEFVPPDRIEPAISRSACQFITFRATRARGYKTFFMLNSAEHEISNAHKYKSIEKLSILRLR